MDAIERLQKLQVLIHDIGGKVVSRKKLHKVIYLLQAAGEDFDQDYYYHHYGVFSPTLMHDIQYGADHGLFCENPGEKGFEISLGKQRILGKKAPKITKIELATRLSREKPPYLEVLSTIVYLHKNGYRRRRLRSKLAELKPELKGLFDRAEAIASQLFGVEPTIK